MCARGDVGVVKSGIGHIGELSLLQKLGHGRDRVLAVLGGGLSGIEG
jgi:hypothetical protein